MFLLTDAARRIRRAPGRLAARFARADHGAPQRDGSETCSAATCQATAVVKADPAAFNLDPGGAADRLSTFELSARRLPFEPDEMARCAVPAQDARNGGLKAGRTADEATPQLTPVWCPEGCGWFHSGCYSTHHRDGWKPAREQRSTLKTRAPRSRWSRALVD